MRRDEIRRLTWEDIDLDAGTISIVGKGDKARVIPIHSALRAILIRGPLPSPYNTYLPHAIPEGVIRTGAVLKADGTHHYSNGEGFTKLLRGFSSRDQFHLFRKTFASSLFANDVSQVDIEEILGWSAKSIFAKHYLVRKPRHLARQVEKVYADDPGSTRLSSDS